MQPGLLFAGRYALEERVGFGGMGEVWRAVDRQLERPVAVKLMREGGAAPELVRRFEREARAAARLQHPGIIVVHDAGAHNGQLFIVMELLQGRDLASILEDSPDGLPVGTAISLAIQAAEALAAAHAGHIVHRDLKPANLFLLTDGRLKICDFGLAWPSDSASRITRTGEVIGTLPYMSPEQCDGKPVDERSDLYSLGCVLFALLTGAPPFSADEPLAILRHHLDTVPEPPSNLRPEITPALDGLVLGLLATLLAYS